MTDSRRRVRAFQEVSDSTSQTLQAAVLAALQQATLAPSEWNLQPTRCRLVAPFTEEGRQLVTAFSVQTSVKDAVGIAVFLSDRHAFHEYGRILLEEDFARGALTEDEYKRMRALFNLGFSKAPFGMGWLVKVFLLPFLQRIMTVPKLPISRYEAWLSKQAGMFFATFLIALNEKKVDWVMVDLFDERRVLRALNLSVQRYYVPFIVVYGKEKERAFRELFHLDASLILV